MSVDPVSFLAPVSGVSPDAMVQVDKPTSGNFQAWLTRELSATNNQLLASDGMLGDLALGRAENLHQVMIAMEKAKLSFQLVTQVRNHLLDAYQEVMRMQV